MEQCMGNPVKNTGTRANPDGPPDPLRRQLMRVLCALFALSCCFLFVWGAFSLLQLSHFEKDQCYVVIYLTITLFLLLWGIITPEQFFKLLGGVQNRLIDFITAWALKRQENKKLNSLGTSGGPADAETTDALDEKDVDAAEDAIEVADPGDDPGREVPTTPQRPPEVDKPRDGGSPSRGAKKTGKSPPKK